MLIYARQNGNYRIALYRNINQLKDAIEMYNGVYLHSVKLLKQK